MSTTRKGLLTFGQLRTPYDDEDEAPAVLVLYTATGQARIVELDDEQLTALLAQTAKAIRNRIRRLNLTGGTS